MSLSTKRLLYVFESGPYSTSAGQEALDAALIGASFEQNISLLFLNDGVFQLLAHSMEKTKDRDVATNQPSRPKLSLRSSLSLKQYTKTFRALADFDIDQVYVHDLSLAARGLLPNQLLIKAEVVDTQGIRRLISDQDKVFTF